MKKLFMCLVSILVMLSVLAGCGVSKTPSVDLPLDKSAGVDEIKAALEYIVAENYDKTDVDHITINPNHGTDEDGDYIALVYLVWNVKNGADTTKRMMAMYSEDLAARTGTNIPGVSELTVFWTIPYHDKNNVSVKYSYERRGSGMYQTDMFISNKLR